MAERIPPKLLEKLVKVLGVTQRRVYRLIEERATAKPLLKRARGALAGVGERNKHPAVCE